MQRILRVPISSFLPHGKRLWNSYLCNNSLVLIIHVAREGSQSTGMQIIPTLSQSWSWNQSMSSKPDRVSATTAWVDSHDETKSSKIICPCKSVRSSISQYIGRSLGNNYPLGKSSIHRQCMSPVCPTMCIKFQLQSLTWLWNESTLKWARIYNPFQNFVLFSVLFIFESYNIVFVHHVSFLFSVIWYDRGKYCLFISLPTSQLFINLYSKS